MFSLTNSLKTMMELELVGLNQFDWNGVLNYFLQLFILQTNDNTPPSETLQQVKTLNYFYETEWRFLNPTWGKTVMIGIRMEEPRTRGRLIWTRSRPLSWSSAGTEPTARWIKLVKLIKDYHPYHWHLTPKTSLQVAQKKRLHLNASLSQYLLKEWQGVYPTSILTGMLLKSKVREI